MENQIATKQNNRIEYLDVAKGIGIMLVVWGHSGGPFNQYITLFHMPFFFLISGYLFNHNNSFWKFTWSKVKSLYIPFVFWNILILILKCLDDFSVKYFIRKVKEIIFTLDKDGVYLGATWFLGSLFTELILYKLFDVLLKRVKYKHIIITIIFVIRAMYAFHVTLPYSLSRTTILGMFLAIGCLLKEYKDKIKFDSGRFAIVAFVLFLLTGAYPGERSMGANQYPSVPVFVTGALMGSYVFIYLSIIIANSRNKVAGKIKQFCCFLSERSIDIVIWHFVFFRVAIAIQLLIDGKSVFKLLKYGKRYDTSGAWWILYFVAGIVCSLLWSELLRRGFWGKILKKLYIIR